MKEKYLLYSYVKRENFLAWPKSRSRFFTDSDGKPDVKLYDISIKIEPPSVRMQDSRRQIFCEVLQHKGERFSKIKREGLFVRQDIIQTGKNFCFILSYVRGEMKARFIK